MSAPVLDRRDWLRLLGSSALALGLGGHVLAARPSRKVVVIGAGILGAAIGYELAKRGAEVTLLERIGPARGTTGDSFAYLNASTKSASRPYFDLNWQGINGWHRWQQELRGALPLQWNGAVYWRDEDQAAATLRSTLSTVKARGYGGEQIDAEQLRRLLPNIRADVIKAAAFYDEEGAVDPVAAVEVLLKAAQQHGASLRYPVEVLGFLVDNGRVRGVKTADGDIHADAVVVAAGIGSQALAQSLDIKLPLTASQNVLIHTAPQPRLLEPVVFAPGSTIRQMLNGRILSSSGHEGSAATAEHLAEQGQRILDNAARYLPELKSAKIERVSVGQRVLPSDNFPAVGFAAKLEQLYFAVTHSGITLAPAIARYATQEILDGIAIDSLKPFRPNRFA